MMRETESRPDFGSKLFECKGFRGDLWSIVIVFHLSFNLLI